MLRRVALFAVLSLLTACRSPTIRDRGCAEDKDCGSPVSAWRCEPQNGECYCRTNDACPARQFCNPVGFCQDRAGCEKSADCLDASLFCDTSTGTCLPKGRCSSDLHCLLGEVCNLSTSQCVPGCRRDGDCPGSSCRCGDVPCVCTATTADGIQKCPIGECDSSFCSNNTFCRFGEQCGVVPDAGTRNQCFSDFHDERRPYCARCLNGGGITTCGTGANYCIIDTRTNATYCGADCSNGESCPRGYGCRDIIVVLTRWQCDANRPCPGDDTLPCQQNSDCKRGGSCVTIPGKPGKFCSGVCRVREGAGFGYCSCQVDLDCPQETCTAGECSISRRKCVNENDCRTIRCVDFDNAGGCLIGQNCTPTAGLTCNEVAK